MAIESSSASSPSTVQTPSPSQAVPVVSGSANISPQHHAPAASTAQQPANLGVGGVSTSTAAFVTTPQKSYGVENRYGGVVAPTVASAGAATQGSGVGRGGSGVAAGGVPAQAPAFTGAEIGILVVLAAVGLYVACKCGCIVWRCICGSRRGGGGARTAAVRGAERPRLSSRMPRVPGYARDSRRSRSSYTRVHAGEHY